jgi:hypothetical protein
MIGWHTSFRQKNVLTHFCWLRNSAQTEFREYEESL